MRDNLKNSTYSRGAALEVGDKAQWLAEGYYTYLSIMQIGQDDTCKNLILRRLSGKNVPEGVLEENDSYFNHHFDFEAYFNRIKYDPLLKKDFERTWLMTAVIQLAGLLKENEYFDHDPILELIYHIRNGMAHGNKFNFDYIGKKRLGKHPAHNKFSWGDFDKQPVFEISLANYEGLQGTNVFFDFISAGQVVTLLSFVSSHLIQISNDDFVLNYITDPKGLVFPDSIEGSLCLAKLNSASGLIFPKKIGGNLCLNNLTSIDGLVLPSMVGGIIDLSRLNPKDKDFLKEKYPDLSGKIK